MTSMDEPVGFSSALAARLWHEPAQKVFVVIDGAGVPDLLDQLYSVDAPPWTCLYQGEQTPDMAEVAPYLVELRQESRFSSRILAGWGEAWGVYVMVREGVELAALRRHLRTLNIVYGPRGEPLLFRWYDPRVFRLVVPTLNTQQLKALFGAVLSFVVEGEPTDLALIYSLSNGALVQETVVPK